MSTLARIDRFDSMFPELFRRWARPMQLFDDADLAPDIRIDVTENDKEFIVTADLPGAKKDDVRVSVDGNYVSIAAEVKKDEEKKEGRSIIKETYRGSMSRGFALACEVDDKAAVARMEDGVLKLTLPKRQGAAASRLLTIQ